MSAPRSERPDVENAYAGAEADAGELTRLLVVDGDISKEEKSGYSPLVASTIIPDQGIPHPTDLVASDFFADLG